VLNEEALSASSAHLALRAVTPEEPAIGRPRYSEAAGLEHHPLVTDFLPRRYRTIGALVIVAVAATAAVEALHRFVVPLAGIYGFESTAAFDLSGAGSVAAWLSAVVLGLVSVTCVLIYSLRRHRIDDFQGRYRVWMAAAGACALLSVESVAPVHRLLTAVAAYYTGWTALRSHAAWWLLLVGLPVGWIALRAWLDARESSLAAVTLGAALASFGVALASYLGIGPAVAPQSEVMITAGAALLGHWMLLVGVVSYSRFVVLDAQGLIPGRRCERTASKQVKLAKTRDENDVASRSTSAGPSGQRRSSREGVAASAPIGSPTTEWVDGSELEADRYDDGDGNAARYGNRKLSKAERKRLRKQKRAA